MASGFLGCDGDDVVKNIKRLLTYLWGFKPINMDVSPVITNGTHAIVIKNPEGLRDACMCKLKELW